jgi:hypothetical protein
MSPTIIDRSTDGWRVCLGEVPTEGPEAGWGGAFDKFHVTVPERLHGTPWRAQFEHGTSSSHCAISVLVFSPTREWSAMVGVPLHDEPYTVYSPIVT